jgi:hypothetical protein
VAVKGRGACVCGRYGNAGDEQLNSAQSRRFVMSVKSSWRVIIVLAALTGSVAQAQTTVDVAKITCEQFALGQVAPQDYLAIWVSGYYYGKNNNTIIEVQQLKENMNDFKRDCLYSKGNLMQAVEKVLSQGK